MDEARDDAYTSSDADVTVYHGKWVALAWAQRLAAHVLTLPIPILNLYLLALAGSLAAYRLPISHTVFGAGVIALIAVLVIGNLFYRAAPDVPYAVPIVFTVGAASLVFSLFMHFGTAGAATAVFFGAWASLIGAVLIAILRAYDKRRPGALAWGAIAAIATAPVLYVSSDTPHVYHAIFRTMEWLCFFLFLFWIALLVCHISVAVAGSLLKRQADKAANASGATPAAARYRDKVERVVWTGRLAVILPTALFVNVTLALWCAVVFLGEAIRPQSEEIWYEPFFSFLYAEAGPFHKISDIGYEIIAAAATPLVAVSLTLMAAATLLMLWAFFPCVVAEIRPPKSRADGTSLGEWLDSGLRLLRWSGRLLFISVVVLLPLGMIMILPEKIEAQWLSELLDWLDPGAYLPSARDIAVGVGTALAGTAVALVAFRGRLLRIARKVRPVLDVALDVDNHLRERPLRENARAKIAARYASLLRHVCEWRGSHGEKYDALVIVAHSQGTVITADLLRFIRTASSIRNSPADRRLERIDATAAAVDPLPIHLLTVGCPLRQLYSLRFRDLYDWARHGISEQWSVPPGNQVIDHGPDPAELNVRSWVNAYRSGDYVGRYLWRPDLCNYRWGGDPVVRSASASGDRVELCIGAGAHTHYFDTTAPDIGIEINGLIARV
ncbi:MAG TPA: hypothetical protein VED01_22395 [Burkholderiales bacterium]|nr:hypothetical protein [Burkholderiales bacterium]